MLNISNWDINVPQARNPGGRKGANPPRKNFALPEKKCWTWFKSIGHSSKNLGPSQKTLRPSWCPKLVTSLIFPNNSTK